MRTLQTFKEYLKLKEDAPTVSAGGGQIAGIGVGPQGEPPVKLKPRKPLTRVRLGRTHV